MAAAKSKKAAKTLDEVIARHADVTLKIAFVEAVLELSIEHFAHHDGLEPKSIVLTNDGRRVPETTVASVIEELRAAILDPLNAELDELKKIKV
jgi:hypothetical protein